MSETVLVTGGGGFVGKALCLKLIQLGFSVRSISRGDYPELEKVGVQTFRADLGADPSTYEQAFKDLSCVFHTASKVDMWGRYDDFFRSNVVATRNIISVCRKFAIKNLVYTSSPSVVADGSSHRGSDESLPYPKSYQAFYPATKALAEQEVLAQNSPSLSTIALRPHLIWGPGDRHLVPSVLEKARSGKLVIVGDGENVVDLCFIEECVDAHILAMQALAQGEASGKAYFISQGQPIKLWEWVNRIVKLYRCPEVKRKLPTALANFLATILEGVSNLIPGKPEPRLTRFMVSQMSTDHWFSIAQAKELLGFTPHNSLDLCFEKLKASIEAHPDRCST